jgi:hypothetical protein
MLARRQARRRQRQLMLLESQNPKHLQKPTQRRPQSVRIASEDGLDAVGKLMRA